MTASAATGRVLTITIPMAPSPALAPNRIGHEHWRNRQQAAKELRAEAWIACEFESVGETGRAVLRNLCSLPGPVHIHEHIVWPKGKRLKDPDSLAVYCKPALDGIVDAGIIPDDSARYVASITTSQAKGDDAHGRIEVTIREVQ